jgi:hypothetical protein
MTPGRSTEKRRPGAFATALFGDPVRKLIALLLAILLWFFIESRITRTIERTLPLQVVSGQRDTGEGQDRLVVALPTDRVVGKEFSDGQTKLDRIKVVIRGPRIRVAAVERAPLNLQITSFLGLDWGNRNSVEFTAADISQNQLVLEGLTLELEPRRIRLDVERIEELRVKLALDLVELRGEQLLSRLETDTAEFSPPEAVVLGPAIGIEQWKRKAGKRFRADLDGAGHGQQVTVGLDLIDAQALGLRLSPAPLLTMRLRPQTSAFHLELPIVVDDMALPPELRGLWQPEARTRAVRIRAGGELRSRLVALSETVDKAQLPDWTAEHLRLHVHIPRPAPGASLGPELDLKARLLLLGPLHAQVDRNECLLDEVVVVKLRRKS